MSRHGLAALGENLLQKVHLSFLVTPSIGGRGA
jgi:hypothetical protein